MDSQITTIEDDDDEPLFEISRVTFLNPASKQGPRELPRKTKYIKICYVPLCPNSSNATPDKMFITVPVNPARRKQWLEIVGKDSAGRNPKSPMFCCQDHFNLKRDMKNYEEHLRKGKVQMMLYQTVVPSVFLCNKYGHLKRTERLKILRQLHEKRNVLLRRHDDDEEEEEEEPEVELRPINRLTSRQRSLQLMKRRRIESEKTVFVEMNGFQENDHSDFIETKENDIDTIVIDDSD